MQTLTAALIKCGDSRAIFCPALESKVRKKEAIIERTLEAAVRKSLQINERKAAVAQQSEFGRNWTPLFRASQTAICARVNQCAIQGSKKSRATCKQASFCLLCCVASCNACFRRTRSNKQRKAERGKCISSRQPRDYQRKAAQNCSCLSFRERK